MKVKVLFIHHGTGIGGAPTSLLNLVNGLDRNKFQIKVAFIKGGIVEEIFRKNGIETEVLNCSNTWFAHNQTGKIQWWYFYRYFKVFMHWRRTAYQVAPAYLAKQEADIVHLNSHVLTSWAFAAKRAGKKVVMHNREAIARGYFGVRYRILKKLIEKNCDRIINISIDNMRRLGLTSNSSVVYNFVEIPKHYRKSMQGTDGRRTVLYLGGMARIKGYEVAVKCLQYLKGNITVQFAGSMGTLSTGGHFMERIKYIIKLSFFRRTYGLLKKIKESNNAEVLGVINDPLRAIDASDILITPFKIEHFSRPAIEAFACGKPVIGSNVDGMNEIIEHGVDGLLVEKDDPKALAQAINYLCENPEIAREMGENGRKKAFELFSPEANVKKVETIYDELMH